ncbi:hypothetical protein ACFLYS_02765 [Chloroflexota bacterium]
MPLKVSHHIISTGDAMLIIPRNFQQCKTYQELTLECGEVKYL